MAGLGRPPRRGARDWPAHPALDERHGESAGQLPSVREERINPAALIKGPLVLSDRYKPFGLPPDMVKLDYANSYPFGIDYPRRTRKYGPADVW